MNTTLDNAPLLATSPAPFSDWAKRTLLCLGASVVLSWVFGSKHPEPAFPTGSMAGAILMGWAFLYGLCSAILLLFRLMTLNPDFPQPLWNRRATFAVIVGTALALAWPSLHVDHSSPVFVWISYTSIAYGTASATRYLTAKCRAKAARGYYSTAAPTL